MIVDSATRQVVNLIITGGTDRSGVILGDPANDGIMKSGGLSVANLAGALTIEQTIDANSGDIILITDEIQINDTVRSIGGDLLLRPQHIGGSVAIVLGDDADLTNDPNYADYMQDNTIFHLSQSELNNLADGFVQITIGDDAAGVYIQIGDPSLDVSTVTVKDPLGDQKCSHKWKDRQLRRGHRVK